MDAPEIVYLRRSINRDVGQIKCSFNLYDTAASGIRHIGKTREKEPRGGTKIVKIMTNIFQYLHYKSGADFISTSGTVSHRTKVGNSYAYKHIAEHMDI